jgi:hypothetical protein
MEALKNSFHTPSQNSNAPPLLAWIAARGAAVLVCIFIAAIPLLFANSTEITNAISYLGSTNPSDFRGHGSFVQLGIHMANDFFMFPQILILFTGYWVFRVKVYAIGYSTMVYVRAMWA